MLKLNDYPCFEEIPSSDEWVEIKEINEGWSKDKKYYIRNKFDAEYLLRVSVIESFSKKIKQFEQLSKIKSKVINYPKPVAFGILTNNQVYMLLTWVRGEKAIDVIKTLPIEKQYSLGVKAGDFLRKLHRIEQKKSTEAWYLEYVKKIEKKIQAVNDCSTIIPKKKMLIEYILKNMTLLNKRPLGLTHGDFHLGNMVIDGETLGIIDFDKLKVADPFDDFKPFVWNVYESKYFESGLITSYFSNRVPEEFFPILALYAAESLISHVPWAQSFSKEEVEIALKVIDDVLVWYDDFKLTIPTWYKKERF